MGQNSSCLPVDDHEREEFIQQGEKTKVVNLIFIYVVINGVWFDLFNTYTVLQQIFLRENCNLLSLILSAENK